MQSRSSLLFLVVLLTLLAVLPSCLSQTTYNAAVVEHTPIAYTGKEIANASTVDSIVNANLNIYEQKIEEAVSRHGAQIIVFPEYGLFGSDFDTREQIRPFLEQIPDPYYDPNEKIVPCGNSTFEDRPILSRASCLARNYSIYLVLDMGDIESCSSNDPKCPSDGVYQYNTLVAFSPAGQLVGMYHKINLYAEPYYNPANVPKTATFTTNFGVTFGMMLCLDIEFSFPSKAYQQMGITDFVFAAEWVNIEPLQTATQVQSGWSRFFSANLLASGNGNDFMTSGSGIYQAGKTLAVNYNPTKRSNEVLLTAQVATQKPTSDTVEAQAQKIVDVLLGVGQEHESFGQFSTATHKEFISYHRFHAKAGSSDSITATSGNTTCTVSYTVSKSQPHEHQSEKYAIVIWQAKDIPGALPAPFAACSLMRCSGGELCNSYSKDALDASTIFTSISISGTFDTKDFNVLPLASSDQAALFDYSDFDYSWDQSTATLTTSSGFDKIVLNAGIMAVTSA
eukprot:TRINITY_DN229_c0_g1_i3.p1 TRINITY_DN229_c0_g1~~TRINITY_DN229_c0_g1_i3.p1  ORF type:complete len:509 (-),score=135.35 TRINITY_DN229_c0_g1_i3:111-1637(-)